jgi:hypothetical protein
MAIANSIIASGDNTILVVPAGKRYAITTILVCNTYTPNPIHDEDGQTVFDLHLVPQGQAIGDRNMVVRSLVLPAGETFTFDSEKIVLEEGDYINIAGESPTELAATVSYLEV